MECTVHPARLRKWAAVCSMHDSISLSALVNTCTAPRFPFFLGAPCASLPAASTFSPALFSTASQRGPTCSSSRTNVSSLWLPSPMAAA
eukprot:scaffold12992_cov58-Phaeocystis_antarctica.AAC.2